MYYEFGSNSNNYFFYDFGAKFQVTQVIPGEF